MQKWEQYSKDELEEMVKTSKSYMQLAEKVGYETSSGYINNNLKQMVEKFDFDISHFGKDKAVLKIDTSRETKKFWREQIKKRGIEALGGKCCNCGQTFEICCYDFHHLEPDQKDFAISSKQTNGAKTWNKVRDELKKCALLCANCHRLLHYGHVDIEIKQYFNDDYYEWNLTEAKQIDHQTLQSLDVYDDCICLMCGGQRSRGCKLCDKCEKERRREFIPPVEELISNLIEVRGNFTKAGDLYGVTDNAVRKWCKNYNIPYHSSDYKA